MSVFHRELHRDNHTSKLNWLRAAVLGANRPPQETCETLVSRAIEAGAADDVTVVMARYHVPE